MKRKKLIGQDWRKERNEFCVVETGLQIKIERQGFIQIKGIKIVEAKRHGKQEWEKESRKLAIAKAGISYLEVTSMHGLNFMSRHIGSERTIYYSRTM